MTQCAWYRILISTKKEASALVGGDTLENHHRKSPQPEIELRLRISVGFQGANDLDCRRASQRDGKRFIVRLIRSHMPGSKEIEDRIQNV
jgi:hypothetical protein